MPRWTTPNGPGGWLTLVLGILLAAIGLTLTVGGAQLAALGGSWYYLIAGLALIASLLILETTVLRVPQLRTNLGTAHHYLEYFHSSKLYGERKQFDRAAAELVRMRQRALAVPDTPENREARAVTIAVALEREGYVRTLAAIDLFERGKREQGLQMAEGAKYAYIEFYRTLFGHVKRPVDPQLESNLGSTPLFFARLQVVRGASQTEGEAIRRLSEWLERQS